MIWVFLYCCGGAYLFECYLINDTRSNFYLVWYFFFGWTKMKIFGTMSMELQWNLGTWLGNNIPRPLVSEVPLVSCILLITSSITVSITQHLLFKELEITIQMLFTLKWQQLHIEFHQVILRTTLWIFHKMVWRWCQDIWDLFLQLALGYTVLQEMDMCLRQL